MSTIDPSQLSAADMSNPALTAQDLADITAARPDLRPYVATHPSLYPALGQWLSDQGVVPAQPPTAEQPVSDQAEAVDEAVAAQIAAVDEAVAEQGGRQPQADDGSGEGEPQCPAQVAVVDQPQEGVPGCLRAGKRVLGLVQSRPVPDEDRQTDTGPPQEVGAPPSDG